MIRGYEAGAGTLPCTAAQAARQKQKLGPRRKRDIRGTLRASRPTPETDRSRAAAGLRPFALITECEAVRVGSTRTLRPPDAAVTIVKLHLNSKRLRRMIGYHGTASSIAVDLAAGQVDVAQGGGELGRGFYAGEHLHLAKAWAVQRYGDRKNNVVEFDVPDPQIVQLNVVYLDGPTATSYRTNIRTGGTTRTHTFGYDMVWSPIVGKSSIVGEQFKWESTASESLLNSASVVRKIV